MTFGIIGNLEKAGLKEAVMLFVKSLRQSGRSFCLQSEIGELLGGKELYPTAASEECIDRADMVVAFGGDGTILAVARLVGARQVPILGVNLGKLGFLADVSPENMEQAIGDIVAGKFVVEDRLVLQATSPARQGKVYFGVNDLVISRSRSPRIIDVETYIDGAFAVTYRGDGLIVSTPTGSTAYALSSGGPIVTPTSHVIGITPISPHTLSGRPIVIPDKSIVRVIVRSHIEEILFSTDGQTEEFFSPPVELEIRKANHSLRLVRRIESSYFDVLRAKLLWGQDARSI
jgi:NAD+ kinase